MDNGSGDDMGQMSLDNSVEKSEKKNDQDQVDGTHYKTQSIKTHEHKTTKKRIKHKRTHNQTIYKTDNYLEHRQ